MTISNEDLVAELREMGESVLDPLTPVEARAAAAIMRAAEVIKAQQEVFRQLLEVLSDTSDTPAGCCYTALDILTGAEAEVIEAQVNDGRAS